MLYECNCGFSAGTATDFYKHLALSKESGESHQLVQARFTERNRFFGRSSGGGKQQAAIQAQAGASAPAVQPAAQKPSQIIKYAAPGTTAAAPGQAGSWVDEYLFVDQEQDASTADRLDTVASTSSNKAHTAVAPEPAAPASTEQVQQLPVRSSLSLGGWSFSSSQTPQAPDAKPAVVATAANEPDESVEHVDCLPTSYNAGDGTAAKALRMSGTMVSAVMATLTPWRWWGGDIETRLGGDALQPEVGGHGDGLQAVADLEAILTWRDPWQSARVFGAGMYLIICWFQVSKGSDFLQPSTLFFALAFLYLLRNAVGSAVRSYKQAVQQQGDQPVSEEVVEDVSHARKEAFRQQEAQLQARAERVLRTAANMLVPYGAAAVVLVMRMLSGRRAITSALVAAALWLGMVLGELRFMTPGTFWALVYVAVFSVPAAYSRRSHVMDALVEDMLRFVTRVIINGNRVSLLMSSGITLVILAVAPLNIVLRTSLAVGAGFALLLWQSQTAMRAAAAAAEARRLEQEADQQ